MASIQRSEAMLAQLLGRVAVGDRAAFRLFYDIHAAKMQAFALKITRQPLLAADAVQEAFLQVWQKASQFNPDRGDPGAWLLSLVRYRALDIARSRRPKVLEDGWLEAAEIEPDALQQLMGNEEGEALQACLQTLPQERRMLLLMAFFDGLTYVEMSNRLAVPLGTIKSSIRRGLQTLRLCLDDQL